MCPRPIRCFPVLVLFCSLAALRAGGGAREALVERSPFWRADRGAETRTASAAYELRGFFGRGDSLEVSIRKSDTGRSEWIRVGASAGGWSVESADPEAGRVVLVVDGVRIGLALSREAGAPPESAGAGGYDLRRHKRAATDDYANVPNEEETPFTRARDAGLARLRAVHPEYFSDINSLTEEQRRAAANAFSEVSRQAEAEVSGRA